MNREAAEGRESALPAGAVFHESIAPSWSQAYAAGGFGRRRACFAPILDRNVRPGRSWLDLGCGSGVLTKELLDRGADVLAVDGSPGMLREGNALIGGKYGSALTWLQSDVQSLSEVADECLDGVLCSSVIEYAERPDDLLGEAARVLRPAGRMIISIPPTFSAVRTVQKAIRTITQCAGAETFGYLAVSRFEIEPTVVRHWLGRAGFVLDRTTSFDPILPVPLLRILRPALMILEAHKRS